jgi:dCTP deaminase
MRGIFMALCGDTIKELIRTRGLVRDEGGAVFDLKTSREMPYLDYVISNVGADNLDVRIGYEFKRLKTSGLSYIDLVSEYEYEKLPLSEDGFFYLQSGEFCLATTMEYIRLPSTIKAQIDSRSSIGRRGLVIQNATHIHAGFEGRITLELKNEAAAAIRIKPGDIVGQIIFDYLDKETSNPYDGVFQGQDGATEPRSSLADLFK